MTGDDEIRRRLVAIARFVAATGLDGTYDYMGAMFGIVDGLPWHDYSAALPVTFWDPVYTTSLVNVLMRGYRYTCEPEFFYLARHYFERGSKGIYGEPTERAAADGIAHHLVDTVFSSADSDFYLAYNKGELHYTYLLFDPAIDLVGP